MAAWVFLWSGRACQRCEAGTIPAMKTITVRLEFPLERVKEPVVSHLVRDFDVSPNVLAADIEAGKGGWMKLGLSGDDANVESALRWVESLGITTKSEPAAAL